MSIQIQGGYSYSLNNGTLTIEIDKVANTTNNYESGTIRFELWLSTSPYSGGTLNGFQIAAIRLDEFPSGGDGRLSPGETYTNISFTDPFDENVPNGTYYPVLVVTEFDGSQFVIADYGTFNGTETIGSGSNDIYGSNASETVQGTFAADDIFGLGGNDNLWGFQGADRLYGGAGNDTLSGHAGADKLFGGMGYDIASYKIAGKGLVANLANPGQNRDHAKGDTYKSIEGLIGSDFKDRLTGDGAANKIWGGDSRDVISGGKGKDTLWGEKGADVISGGGGGDRLLGGAGNDVLKGGAGYDVLFGGAGNDRFVFFSVAEIGVGLNRDQIRDFAHFSKDKINLSNIDAREDVAGDQAFTFISNNGFSGKSGQLKYQNGVLAGDTNGDGAGDFQIKVDITDFNRLTADDFIL